VKWLADGGAVGLAGLLYAREQKGVFDLLLVVLRGGYQGVGRYAIGVSSALNTPADSWS